MRDLLTAFCWMFVGLVFAVQAYMGTPVSNAELGAFMAAGIGVLVLVAGGDS